MLAFATFGVLVPFFYYNVFGSAERARKIFMGDTGSLTLGYVLSFLAIKYSQYNPDVTPYTEGAFVIAFSTLIVPAFDVIRVVMVRVRSGKSPFEPDKNHIHHIPDTLKNTWRHLTNSNIQGYSPENFQLFSKLVE